MPNLSRAVTWWEEWQLRILVLGSLFVQWFLFLSATLRKRAIPSWSRFLIWLAYLGSDALAIYALATLFNRHKNQDGSSRSNLLEVMWAPILLLHLGGLETISAYNMEDNELWRRNIVTAVSQVTVAIYVFCKSWPAGGDKRLLVAAILFFVHGVNRCMNKPSYLMAGSLFGLLVSADRAGAVSARRGGINTSAPLECFVQDARAFIDADNNPPPTPGDGVSVPVLHVPHRLAVLHEPQRLILELLSPYSDRILLLKYFWVLDAHEAYNKLRRGLSNIFDQIYTKKKDIVGKYIINFNPFTVRKTAVRKEGSTAICVVTYMELAARMLLQLPATTLFLKSHKEAYNQVDVKVTYILLCSSVVLEVCVFVFARLRDSDMSRWPETVAQYSLIGYFTKRHSDWRIVLSNTVKLTAGIISVDNDYTESLLQPLYSIESCGPSSSRSIVKLVLQHLKTGWKDHISDAATYRMFNNQRGQLTLRSNGCLQDLGWSLMGPFDESVLLWHIATDFCFYYSNGDHQCGTDRQSPDASSNGQCRGFAWCENSLHHQKAVQCREMSNYMVHLLHLNPEMLMVGARPYLFSTAFEELEAMLMSRFPSEFEILKKMFLERILFVLPEGRELTQGIIRVILSAEDSQEEEDSQQGFIKNAWVIAEILLSLGDEKMWEVIQGVWVEKLCFSAGRSRGYLHAKSLGTGGELLSYIWLLMSYMGMETLAEKIQKEELPCEGGNTHTGLSSSTSEVHTGPSSSTSEIITGSTPSSSRLPTDTAPSTSEICITLH
ncbi:hypothetical protein ACP4OV_025230 [Aristida adscensionis]